MSFQAYLDNIEAKTGISPAEFKKLADKKGFLKKKSCRRRQSRRHSKVAKGRVPVRTWSCNCPFCIV